MSPLTGIKPESCQVTPEDSVTRERPAGHTGLSAQAFAWGKHLNLAAQMLMQGLDRGSVSKSLGKHES